MRFTEDVDVPIPLIDALETGELVFFVGAGASISAPSSLPDFQALSVRVAEASSFRKPHEGEPLDMFFGLLERSGASVNALVAQELNKPESAPNRIHQAVVRLALASNAPKIITTNFDTLLQRAWSDLSEDFEEFVGPAVPLGDDFTGLVQLHGSVKSSDPNFVLTERSFGAAYLTRGWATRFLVDVFERYTVVFVGYSHQDPVMRYVATALSMATKRYAFVGVDDEGNSEVLAALRILGVEAVPFPKGNNYLALPDVLEEWARYAENDWLANRNRLREILLSIENVIPQETDFLERYLSTENGVEHFSTICLNLPHDRQREVYLWVRNLPLLEAIFNRRIEAEYTGDINPLVRWLTNYYLNSEKSTNDLWLDLITFGTSIQKQFYDDLELAAYRAVLNGGSWASLVITYLHTSIPGISAPELLGWTPFEWGVKRNPTVPELKRLLHPRMEPAKPFGARGVQEFSFRLKWPTDGHHLRAILEREDEPPTVPVLEAVERAIEDAYALLKAFDLDFRYDPVAGGVVDLEEPADGYQDTVVVLVRYIANACVAGLITEEHWLRWWASDKTVLRRCALLALKHQAHTSPQEKVNWVLGNVDDLFDPTVRRETFNLLRHNVGLIPDCLREEVFTRITGTGKSPVDVHQALNIVTSGLEDWPRAIEEIERLEAEDETVQKYLTGNLERDKDPIYPNDHSVMYSLEDLDEYLDQVSQDGLGTSESLVSGLRDLLEKEPENAISLALTALESSRENAGLVSTIAIEAIRPELVVRSSSKFLELCQKSSHVDLTSLALVLSESCSLVKDAASQDDLNEAISILWRKNSDKYEQKDLYVDQDILQWPELLIEALVGLAFARWKFTEQGQEDAAHYFHSQISDYLREDDLKPLVARALGRRLGFICELDESLSLETVLPLFFEESTSQFAWRGYLQKPQLSRTEPMKGIVKQLLEQGWEYMAANDSLRSRFFEVVVVSLENQIYRTEETHVILENCVVALKDSERSLFIQFLGNRLNREGDKALWDNGIEDFIKRRLGDQPRKLEWAELQAISDLPLQNPTLAGDLVPDLVAFADKEKLPILNAGSDLFIQAWSARDAEKIAPYIRLRIQQAGFAPHAEYALSQALMRVRDPGPETRKLKIELGLPDR